MSCIYNYYKDDEIYYPHLYCKITNKYCIYSKRCEKVEKFIPLDNEEECYLYHMEKRKNIPNGSKYIVFKKRNYLYVNIDDDKVEKIKNTLGDFEQNYIYVKDGIDGYEISLTPFEQKRTYTRKKINEEKRD